MGRILDWYKKEIGWDFYFLVEDFGVLFVIKVYNYYKKFGYNIEVMGVSFCNIGEIIELVGCDLLIILLGLLGELELIICELFIKFFVEKVV